MNRGLPVLDQPRGRRFDVAINEGYTLYNKYNQLSFEGRFHL